MSQDQLDDELKEYISEFDNLLNFDDEICQVCGIDLSSAIDPINTFWAKIAQVEDGADAKIVMQYLMYCLLIRK